MHKVKSLSEHKLYNLCKGRGLLPKTNFNEWTYTFYGAAIGWKGGRKKTMEY